MIRLSRTQKAKLLALEPVRIAGTGQPPVEVGHVLVIVKGLTLTVDKIRVVKGGGWSLGYTLRDTRDLEQAHHLRSTPPVHVEDGKEPTPASIAQARMESSYTGRADSMGAGHCPPIEWVDAEAKDRRQGDAARRLSARDERLREELEQLEGAHARFHRFAVETGVDARSDMRVVERRIADVKRKIEKAA